MSTKTEHIRHIDKTRQDHMPVAERPRVKQWQARIDTMRGADVKVSVPEFESNLTEMELV